MPSACEPIERRTRIAGVPGAESPRSTRSVEPAPTLPSKKGAAMTDKEVVETIYGKHSKYEIIKKSNVLGSEYYIYKNSKYHRGSFSTLRAAVEAAQAEG
jgi:hypothetical protein